MKKICLIIPVLWVNLSGQFVPTISSSVTDDAASVILNPAGLGVSRQLSTLFLVPMDFTRLDSAQNDFSVYAQIGRTGLGYTYLAEGRD
ncbi:MAG: hypothetical protein ACE5GH_03360, partial [Fidelibacterota bacterium]